MAGEPGQWLERLTGCLDVLFGHWNLVPKPGEVPDCSGVPLCWTLSSSMGACSQQVCRLIHGCTGHGFGSKSQSETDWFRFSFFRELRGYTLHRLISASVGTNLREGLWMVEITSRPKFYQHHIIRSTSQSLVCPSSGMDPFTALFSFFRMVLPVLPTAEWSLIPEALLPGLRGLWLFTLWLSQRAPQLQLSSTGSGWFWVDQGVQCYPPWQ